MLFIVVVGGNGRWTQDDDDVMNSVRKWLTVLARWERSFRGTCLGCLWVAVYSIWSQEVNRSVECRSNLLLGDCVLFFGEFDGWRLRLADVTRE